LKSSKPYVLSIELADKPEREDELLFPAIREIAFTILPIRGSESMEVMDEPGGSGGKPLLPKVMAEEEEDNLDSEAREPA
jgi:hypothetical protein